MEKLNEESNGKKYNETINNDKKNFKNDFVDLCNNYNIMPEKAIILMANNLKKNKPEKTQGR